jgi:hypothetical protein
MTACEVETPSKNWPNSFGRLPLFVHFPYLLPTLIASAILSVGAFLSLFLAWDGGPREGAIRLPIEKAADEERGVANAQSPAPTNIDLGETPIQEDRTPSFGALNMKKKISGYFARRVLEAYGQDTPGTPSLPPPAPGPSLIPRNRVPSRGARLSGSAYGYRPRHASQPTFTTALRRTSTVSTTARQRRGSIRPEDGISTPPPEELSLAQRLLIGS